MCANSRTFLLAVVFVLLAGVTFAQAPLLPPNPVPVTPPVAPSVAPPVPPPGAPPMPAPQVPLQPPNSLPPVQPPLPVVVPPAPSTGLADPGPNGWAIYGPPSGVPTFFVGFELDVLKPVFKNDLQGAVMLPDGSTSTIHPLRSDLSWTASPLFQLGYKLPDSLGEFVLGYRFIVSDGTQTLSDDAGNPLAVKSRLNVNVIDFDYNSARFSPGPRWDMRWTIGARIATLFYDSQEDSATFDQKASTYFYGAGPHAAIEVERKLGVLPSFGFFAKADGTVLVGQNTQRFSETTFDSNGNLESGSNFERKTQTVEVVNLQAGISYTPANAEFLRFTLGYEYEHWFSASRIGDSHGDLSTQGVFFRGQFDF